MKSWGGYLKDIQKKKTDMVGHRDNSNLTNMRPIRTCIIPNPMSDMWNRLKEKALSENNEASNQVLRMMTEIEVEVFNESFKTVKLPEEPETRLYNVKGVQIK